MKPSWSCIEGILISMRAKGQRGTRKEIRTPDHGSGFLKDSPLIVISVPTGISPVGFEVVIHKRLLTNLPEITGLLPMGTYNR